MRPPVHRGAEDAIREGRLRPLSGRAATGLAILLILMTAGWSGWRASDTHLLSCHVDCGEVFIAELQVRNLELFGPRWGLMENQGTSPDIDNQPFLYTHNVNLGSLVAVAL